MQRFEYSSTSSSRPSSSRTLVADEDDDFMAGSTSTAGPPPDSPISTGRFPRPQWSLATGRRFGSGRNSTANSFSTHTLRANNTESFRPFRDDSSSGSGHRRGSHSRTMSNTSVSPMGSSSPQEWGRSFRLFNTSRLAASLSGSRQRESSVHHVYRSVFLNGRHTRGNSTIGDTERSILNSSLAGHQRQGSFFGTISGHGSRLIGWPADASVGGTFASTMIPSAGVNLTPTVSIGSPLLGPSRFFNSSAVCRSPASGVRSKNRVVACCAMGCGSPPASPFQEELALSMNALRSHIALTGKTIIRGDLQHPMEIKEGPLIATGGFAKVFAGVNTVRGELVAIKEVNIAGVEDIKALNSIEEEFALLKSLHHPNIVSYSLFEHSKSQQVCRIVMEMLAGDSTFHLLQKFGPLTEAVLRIMTRNLLQAIQFIHKEGIFHRDIKPGNILVGHRGDVKLCDFGCSKRVSELSKVASCIIGTPVYMSPEFIKGDADHKADIWSMGCTLFELSTGLLPWYHSGVKDYLPLMFYITTTSETPLVFPTHEMKMEFSAEYLNFLELCFTRNAANRPEAEELLKHPWITGSRLAPHHTPSSIPFSLHTEGVEVLQGTLTPRRLSTSSSPRDSAVERDETSFTGSDQLQRSLSMMPTAQLGDEEIGCRQELEVVAAATALDLCAALMSTLEIPPRLSNELHAVEAGSATGDTSPSLTRTFSIPSPSLSHRGGVTNSIGEFPSPVFSPEHSIVHDNYHYSQVPLGSSAGNFVLPLELNFDTAPPQQQYLRINEDGNLDVVHLPDDETEDILHAKSVSSDSLFPAVHGGRLVSPARNSSFSRGSISPRATHAIGGGFNLLERPFSPLTTAGGSGGSGVSRGESPFRGVASLPTSPQGIPAPPQLYRPTPLPANLSQSLSNCGSPHNSHTVVSTASKTFNSVDTGATPTPRVMSPTSVRHSGSFRALNDRLKTQADGKLHMSFSVSTAPGHEINVELNVDVADVQCKMVDSQPNFVVSFTDDVRSQIASKIKELAVEPAPSTSSQNHSTYTASTSSSSGTEPRHTPPGPHFYNSPKFTSTSRPQGQPISRLSAGNLSRFPAGLSSETMTSPTGLVGSEYPPPATSRPSNASATSGSFHTQGSLTFSPKMSPRTSPARRRQ